MTGREIENTLLRELDRHQPNVELLENHMAIDLITARKLGLRRRRSLSRRLRARREKPAKWKPFARDRFVLATGGCGKVYLYTTNPDIATGDGVAMA